MHCVACDGELSLFGRRLGYEYHRCSECGTIQLVPMPDKTELDRAYETQYATAAHHEQDPERCNRAIRTYYQAIVKTLKDHRVSGTVLDYGAGWGGLCEMLVENGFTCRGLEVSDNMIEYCRQHDLPVDHGDITSVEGDSFSAIVLCTVFEHLVDHDNWLARANGLLETGGLLVTSQPTARFADVVGRLVRMGDIEAELPRVHRIFCPPWHTVFFSSDGMRTLASRHGFSVVEIRPAPQERAGGLAQIVAVCLEMVNRLAWPVLGERWPLIPGHIFVLKKEHEAN